MNAILVDKKVVLEPDILAWARWFESANRRVAETVIPPNNIRVSTVFLGIDHGWHGKPMWFETMIFGGKHDEYTTRCETWDEALEMHKLAVQTLISD